jgi:hypothetical protein
MAEVIEGVNELSLDALAFMDLEGTLTYGKRKVPKKAEPIHMRKLLNDEALEGENEIGYWSGIHLLSGESPESYFSRVRDWKENEINKEEFEAKNLSLWDNMIENSSFKTAEEFIEWYNAKFLDLRDKAEKLVETCQNKGFETGIVSHTSTSLSKHAAEKLGLGYVFPTWTLKLDKNTFSSPEKTKYADEKSHILNDLKQAGVEQIVFFGNGENDVNIAQQADKSYMIKNREEVDYANTDAFTGNFEQVLEKFESGEVSG